MAESADEVVVTYLEMTERPAAPVPPAPVGPQLALIRAHDPPEGYFLYLYRAVGERWGWTDWVEAGAEAREAFCRHPQVELYTLMTDGWPGGFFMLDLRAPGVCDLAYFGLVPEMIGRGLGRWLLATAVEMGWERPDVVKLTVNTCTLDHPRALGNYQRAGFEPVRQVAVPAKSASATG
jgi:GNAT superfamily N-acetyltransferase